MRRERSKAGGDVAYSAIFDCILLDLKSMC